MACKQEFWVLLNVKTFGLSRYDSEGVASREARRLSLENPGIEYAVLKSVKSFLVDTPQPTEYEHGDYPF
jgi:hypothetical protein